MSGEALKHVHRRTSMPGHSGNRNRGAIPYSKNADILTSAEGATNAGRGNRPNYNYKPFGTVLCGADNSTDSLGSTFTL